MDYRNRLERLRRSLAEKEVDALLVSQPENRLYLSGFSGSAGYLLISTKDAILATDFRYIEQAGRQSPDFRVFRMSGEVAGWFPGLIGGTDVKRLAFEAGQVTFELYRQLSEALSKAESPVKLAPTEGIVESIRAIKEPEEVQLISRAIALTDAAFSYIEETARIGMTELELAWLIEKFLREHGSEAMPFDLIVAAGPNAALPHAHPSDRPIESGEPVVIDIGARVGGYISDMTRTICLGAADATFKKVYDTVLGAQLAAIALIKSGMTGDEADSMARTVIEEAGYGESFGHGLGHGVGLATHELPRLGAKSSDVLTDGAVFTIEPGIYVTGWGGVRIEDMVVLREGKVQVLSKAGKIPGKS